MKIPTDILAKIAIAWTPPVNEQEPGFLFRRRLAGMTVPVLRLENLRLTRQRRSIWKKLFMDGVIVPYHVTDASIIDRHTLHGTEGR